MAGVEEQGLRLLPADWLERHDAGDGCWGGAVDIARGVSKTGRMVGTLRTRGRLAAPLILTSVKQTLYVKRALHVKQTLFHSRASGWGQLNEVRSHAIWAAAFPLSPPWFWKDSAGRLGFRKRPTPFEAWT